MGRFADLSADELRKELAGFHVKPGAFSTNFSLDRLFSGVAGCSQVKEGNRRQVYFLQTDQGDFFLKITTLIRPKDRLRHRILFRRRWAEWRNLHRLHFEGIDAAEPVLKGESCKIFPDVFFILTRKVCGEPLSSSLSLDAKKAGRNIARMHSKGFYHADFHPGNLIINPDGNPCLIDVQEVFFFCFLPRSLRIFNLGKLFFYLEHKEGINGWFADFLKGYNSAAYSNWGKPIKLEDVIKAALRHRNIRFRSRARRCCKNSTEFAVVKTKNLKGYIKRGFSWSRNDLVHALQNSRTVKQGKIVEYNNICIKINRERLFHKDRCLACWKAARALEVRGISVPVSYAYFKMGAKSFFISGFMKEAVLLNDYLSSFSRLSGWRKKREALKKFASWIKKIHDLDILQKDFKSSNVLCQNGTYFMIDLDNVRFRPVSKKEKIINLAQLNASISNAVTCKDRLRFFYYYSKGSISREVKRKIYKKIMAITSTKKTSAFNLDTGQLIIF